MKKLINPELEVIKFEVEDIITTSLEGPTVTGPNMGSGDGEGGNPTFPPFGGNPR